MKNARKLDRTSSVFTTWPISFMLEGGDVFQAKVHSLNAWRWRMLIKIINELGLKLGGLAEVKQWFSTSTFERGNAYQMFCSDNPKSSLAENSSGELGVGQTQR